MIFGKSSQWWQRTRSYSAPLLTDASLLVSECSLAENIFAHGTRRERIASDISDIVFHEIMEQPVKEQLEEFDFNEVGLTTLDAEARLEEYGRNELPEKVDRKWLVFIRLFWAPMPIMIWIAIIIELGIQNYIDMGILLLIQFANASIRCVKRYPCVRALYYSRRF